MSNDLLLLTYSFQQISHGPTDHVSETFLVMKVYLVILVLLSDSSASEAYCIVGISHVAQFLFIIYIYITARNTQSSAKEVRTSIK